MEYIGTESLKKSYAQVLIENNRAERGIQIQKKERSEPIFEGLALHPENEPIKESINSGLTEISIDLAGLNKEFVHLGEQYSSLLNNATERLKLIDDKIKKEEDRIRDLNAICGNYRQFDSILELNSTNCSGSFSYEDGLFYGKISVNKKIKAKVLDVQGNGKEEGEKSRPNLVDNDVLTKWTYVTKDENARCTITLSSEEPFNAVKIQTSDDIIVEEVETSNDDGITYLSNMSEEIHINNREHRYNHPNYVYESGIIAFPFTRFAKIRVRSAKKDKINDIVIDNIIVSGSEYEMATLEKSSIISNPVESIAVFANEYIPPHFLSEDYIEYILTVNGVDYKVVPINGHKPGIKVIRFANYSDNNNYTVHINETIKSAKLKVVIRTTRNNETPYLSNLKICVGKVAL